MEIMILDIGSNIIKYGLGGLRAPYIIKNDSLKKRLKDICLLCPNIIVCEPLNRPKHFRNKISNYLAKYNIKKVVFINKQLLALYGLGKDYGLVIDIGKLIKIVVFYDSYMIENTISYLKNNANIDEMCDKIREVIKKVAIDLRKAIASNIVVIGYNNIDNIGKKIINRLDSTYVYTVNVPKNKNLTWLGGSIISQIPDKINWSLSFF